MNTIYHFNNLLDELKKLAGNKAGTLSRLYKLGYNVPEGFIILPDAFNNDTLTEQSWAEVHVQLAHMRKKYKDISFAVRSSALSEDSLHASFAGEFETVLDLETDNDIREAIHSVRRSRHNVRVHSYNKAMGLEDSEHEIAVIIQRFIRADYSGVLFTADPVTGDLMHMTGNFVIGMGEKLVSGQINPGVFKYKRPKGKYIGPQEIKDISRKLYKQACKLESDLGDKQDIEWAVKNKCLYILQSRPITTMQGYNLITGERNDSFTGNYLWSCTNLDEATPAINKICTFQWDKINLINNSNSKHSINITDYIPLIFLKTTGYIGQRLYNNQSLTVSLMLPFMGGNIRKALQLTASFNGEFPDDIDVPLIPISVKIWWTTILPGFVKLMYKHTSLRKKFSKFSMDAPGQCKELLKHIKQIQTGSELSILWKEVIEPLDSTALLMNSALNRQSITETFRLNQSLRKLVGQQDANTITSNYSSVSYELESLGPLTGLDKVIHGEMDRDTYLEKYGHRCVNETDISFPRPLEDPTWLDNKIDDFIKSGNDIMKLIKDQRSAFDSAWERLYSQYPKKSKYIQKKLIKAAYAANQRETLKSIWARITYVIRVWALRAGEFTGLGEDIFFLSNNDIKNLLNGDDTPVKYIPIRKETYERYKKLPPYPQIIVGHFDPFKWAADPNRRNDIYIANKPLPPINESNTDVIKGFPGALGIVEGTVRRIDSIEESSQFLKGEILVTRLTNIGWTLLFSKTSAIITDVGAPLSHAAIVARELGIPAVVGCRDATLRLKTGDRVRVDGSMGIVKILDKI